MRNASRNSSLVWALIALAAIATIGTRAFRVGGVGGLLLAVLVVLAAVLIVRELMTRPGPGLTRRRPATKNVTPTEPSLPAPGRAIASSAHPPVVVVERPSSTHDLEERLRKLERLRANGLLTDDEYEAKRAQLIAEL